MATTVTLTVSDLIEETLNFLYRVQERPREAPLAATITSGATAISVDSEYGKLIHNTSLIEIDSEVMLVTRSEGDGLLTVSRGYAGTTAAAHTAADKIRINPQHLRSEITRHLIRFFTGPANLWLPRYETETLSPATNAVHYVSLPADCVSVVEVRFYSASSGRIVHLGNWEMHENLPIAGYPTGKILQLTTAASSDDDIVVTYHMPHTFTLTDGTTEIAASAVTETSKIVVPFGVEGLPTVYAAAVLLTGRELARLEADHIEEWNQDEAIRQGIPLRFIQSLWTQFYRGIDEARRLQYKPRHRPYRKMNGIGLR